MKYKVGLIGAGNMGGAIVQGALDSGVLSAKEIYVYDVNGEQAAKLSEAYGVTSCASPAELADWADMILLAVKPNVAEKALSAVPLADKAVISIVAGLDYERLAKYTKGANARLLRVMPNTPLLVGQGAVALAMPSTFRPDELDFAEELFSQLGMVKRVSESLMSAVTGVSGSGPAYVYMFLEAMADAGVKHGLPRDMAVDLAAQTIAGSAQMVLQTHQHPGVLKDNVCSPGGTTIEAVSVLEEKGFRSAVIQAVDACIAKADQL